MMISSHHLIQAPATEVRSYENCCVRIASPALARAWTGVWVSVFSRIQRASRSGSAPAAMNTARMLMSELLRMTEGATVVRLSAGWC